MMSVSALLVIFAKAPIAGNVKTRLIPDIGVEAATALQRELIERCMEQYCDHKNFDVQLWCAPDVNHEFFQYCAREYNVSLYPQRGGDIGSRMSYAFSTVLEEYGRVVLIGTDVPALDISIVKQALDELEAHDVVIVPAEDGGYVLIAMRDHFAEVFLSVPWGSAQVMNKTRENIRASGLRYKELDTCWDVDRLEDYQRYLDMKRS